MEEMSYVVHFLFTSAHFHLALVVDRISDFVTAAATKLSCFSSNKKNFSFVFELSL